MKIIYLGAFRFPNKDAASSRVLNVARALRESGHTVSFISWGGEQRDEDYCDDGLYRFDGFPYVITNELESFGGIMSKVFTLLSRGTKTKKILKSSIGDIDAIITYNNSLTSWLINFCKKHNIYLISDLTEWFSYNELKIFQIPGYVYEMYCLQRRIKNKIVISSYLDLFYKNTHNVVVPATCDKLEKKWNVKIHKDELNSERFDGTTLIYAGTPARKDALHYCISAVQQLIDEGAKIRFLILGITRSDYLKKYGRLLRSRSLSDDIVFLGRVSQESVPSYYASSDFMILLREVTRKSEAGFPTKFTESFCSGTPVIANITSDLNRYLIDGVTGYVLPNVSEESVYNTIKYKVLNTSKDILNEMKFNVFKVAKELDYHYYVDSLRVFLDDLK